MSDTEDEKPFVVERAKTGRAKCKKCKCPVESASVRIAKLMSNPFGEGKMKAWHHPTCLFEVFAKQRASTKRIENFEDDVAGWDALDDEGKAMLREKLEDFEKSAPFQGAKKASPTKKQAPAKPTVPTKKTASEPKASGSRSSSVRVDAPVAPNRRLSETKQQQTAESSRDNSFREFRRLCANIANANAYTAKTAIVREFFVKGCDGDGFKGDVALWCKLLLPGVTKRVYNLQSKQLVKLFSRLFNKNEDDMLEHLEQGDVAETIQIFFEQSSLIQPSTKSVLSLREVDQFLEKLATLTREEEQILHFKSIAEKCTSNDLKMIVRLVKHDLRMTSGAKHILDAIHRDAYAAFQVSRDLESVVTRFLTNSKITTTPTKGEDTTSKSKANGSKVSLALMTPVLPMLAEACKSVDMAMKKCPRGMLSEIKYDGERVQVHKEGDEFRYFSRSLKPVMPHKVSHFKDYIPEAFPGGDDLILDAEVLLVDTKTGKPLPFGSLGAHKKTEFKDANVCLFVFDCLYYNGEILLDKSMRERREILKKKMKVIENRIMLSEIEEVQDPRDLANMIAKVIKLGLEGLVLKDVTGKYEPGKRHWLKVKKDYLLDGAIADTADLVVLGAWYGTGKKGGMMSVFLMGCYDEDRDRWVTVTKVHTGHDDATLERLQGELQMEKISKDMNLLPKWLHANKPMVPDFVAKDPKKQPVWEITGAEFTNQGFHTADGISIRFPRITRVRDDKDWKTATSLKELKHLFAQSSDSVDVNLLLAGHSSNESVSPESGAATKRKRDKLADGSISGWLNNRGQINDSLKTEKAEVAEDENKAPGDKRINVEVDTDKSLETDENDDDQKTKKLAKVRTDGRTRKDAEDANRASKRKSDTSHPSTSADPNNGFSPKRKCYTSSPGSSRSTEYTNVDEDPKKLGSGIFEGIRLAFAPEVATGKKNLRRILKTLGAELLEAGDQRKATHVIHSEQEIPSDVIMKPTDVPRTARHVTEEWLKVSLSRNELPDPEGFAVTLTEAYCECPCPHRG